MKLDIEEIKDRRKKFVTERRNEVLQQVQTTLINYGLVELTENEHGFLEGWKVVVHEEDKEFLHDTLLETGLIRYGQRFELSE